MNIFRLDNNPVKAAEFLCDRHVHKMVLETAQILCFAHHNMGTSKADIPYKLNKAHLKHPTVLWCQDSEDNYEWTLAHGLAISTEYIFRYGKQHASHSVLEWAGFFRLKSYTNKGLAIPQCFGKYGNECIDLNDSVAGYRNYYNVVKRYEMKTGCKWEKGRKSPDWYENFIK